MRDGCIEWAMARDHRGYGRRGVNGKMLQAHRFAWEEERGPIPPGMCVLHRCDNPPCINVEHLFLGTVADNNRDMANKGRDKNSKKTHCPKGHQLSGLNLVAFMLARRRRLCRICYNEQQRNGKRRARANAREFAP